MAVVMGEAILTTPIASVASLLIAMMRATDGGMDAAQGVILSSHEHAGIGGGIGTTNKHRTTHKAPSSLNSFTVDTF